MIMSSSGSDAFRYLASDERQSRVKLLPTLQPLAAAKRPQFAWRWIS